ncbi:MAG: hypothetical protein LUI60_06010 [Clostridia bacterium]|nr:hypothetical protein [Clostridia bacterium]
MDEAKNKGGNESSPEQLKSYIKVANAGIWIVIAAIIALLVGVCVWGVFGRLETTVDAVAVCEEGKITAYIKQEDYSSVEEGMALKIDGEEYEVAYVSTEWITVSADNLSEYAAYLGGFSSGDIIYSLQAYGSVSSGIYAAQIVVESISPISFLFS